MAQAPIIAKVSSLSGEAYARNAEGRLRRLKLGDEIREGESVVTADGAQVVLQLADGRQLAVSPSDVVRIDAEVAAEFKPDATDSAVANDPKAFRGISEALARGEDLDALLEDPAAGNAGPSGEGHTFVEFARIVETIDPLSYQFSTARVAPPESVQAPAVGDGEAAPVAATPVGTDSILLPDGQTLAEDTVATGNVLANDSDTDDILSVTGFTVAGVAGSFAAGQTASIAGIGTLSIGANGDYSFTPVADWNGTVPTVSYTTSTGSTSSLDLTVTPVNDAPTPADPGNPAFDPATGNYRATTPEDTPVSGQVVGSDADGDQLTYAKGSDPANGTVTVNADGTWTYTPGPNYNGSDSFTVSIADGHGGTATSTVSIGVTPADDASVLAPDSQSVLEDTVATGNVLANDSDADDVLSVAGFTVAGVAGSFAAGQTATIAGAGTLTIAANGDYTFTPVADWNGTVPTVSYTTNTGATSTLDITVSPLDDTPSVSDDVATTLEDTPVIIRVLDNDSDADGDPLTIVAIAGQPVAAGDTVAVANGTATLNVDGTITFTPAANYHGPASFTYTATDGRTPVSADVNVTVGAVNDGPQAVNDSATTPEDTPVTILVRANDSDTDGEPLTVSAFTNPANGTVTLNAQGNLVYSPNADFNGTDTFSYTIGDGQGGFDTASVTVNVGGSNDAPLANPDSGSTTEDVTLVVTAADGVILGAAGADSDLDGDSLAVSGIAFGASIGTVGSALAGAWGNLTLNADGSYTYVPNAAAQALDDGESRTDVFTYTVADPGGLSSTTTLSLTVSGANDGPLAIDDARTTPEDTPVTIAVLGNDSDVDGEPLRVSAIAGQPVAAGDSVAVANGMATLNADGTITFTPAAGYNGPADFSYTITDGTASDTANVHLVIDDVNDPPVALDNVVNGSEDSPVNFDPRSNDSDPDGDPLTITEINGQPLALSTPVTLAQGVVSLNADGTLTFTPNPNFNGPLSFQYTIADGRGGSDSAVVNLNIAAVDDPSVLVADANTTPEDTAVSGNVLANDSDIDNSLAVASFTVNGVAGSFAAGQTATIAGIGAITVDANGDYTFTPAVDWNGTVPTVNFTTNTGSASTLDITVTPLDDAFTDANEVVSVAEDTILTGTVLTGTTSVDGAITVSGFMVAGVAGSFTAGQTANIAGVGSLSIAANGDYSFTPVANYNGPVPMATYTLTDGSSGDPSTLSITVTPVDDAFADANEVVSSAEDTTLTGTVLSGTSSVDSPVTVSGFTVAGVAGSFTAGQTAAIAGVGSLQINANGDYTFTPAANYNGPVPVATYMLTDGSSGDTSTLAITVTPANDNPLALDDSNSVPINTPTSGNVLANDSDLDGNSLAVTGFTVAGVAGSFTAGQTANIAGVGTLSIAANGDYTFTPAANYAGAIPVATYSISDGQGGTDSATLSLGMGNNTAPDAINDGPVAVTEDTPVSGNVLVNDSDPDGNSLTVTGFTVAGVAGSFTAGQTANIAGVGTLQINANGDYSFTPAANYHGPVPVATYSISDGLGGTDSATLTLGLVVPVDDAFTDANEVVSVVEDTTLTGTVLSGTSSVDGPMTVSGFTVTGVAGSFTAGQTANIADVGTLSIAANGDYSFTPVANYNGPVPMATYTLTDGSSGDTSTLSITVNPVDDAFSDANEVVSVAEDTILTGSVLTGTSSVDGPVTVSGFTVVGVAGAFTAGQTANIAGVGTLNIAANGDYSFTPVANFNGAVPVATYTLTDGSSGDTSTLSITVTPVDDAFSDANEVVSVAEDTTLSGSVLTGTTSVDGPVTVSGFTVAGVAGAFTAGQTASIAGVGTLSITANGDYSFTPVANYNGPVPLATYTLTDGSSGDTSTLSITVTPVDDAFADANEVVSVAEDTTLTGTVLSGTSSVDGPVTLTGFTVAGVAGAFTAGQTASIAGVGTLSITANGDYSFTPVANYNGPVPLATYTLTDGSSGDTSTLNITVTPVDDAFADANEVVSVAEDTTLTDTVLSGTTSVDGPVTVSGFTVAGVAGAFTAGQTAAIAGVGSLQINANGDYTFTPVANYNGPVPMATYTLTDGSSGDTSTLSITVTPVDDAFADANEVVSVAEDTTLTGSVLTGTSSVDGPVTVSGFTVAGVAGSFTAGQTATITGVGSLQVNANGDYSFTPVANYNGPVPLATYTLTDGSSGDTSTLSITVTPVDDVFTDANEVVSVAEDTTLTGSVLTGTTSVDGPVTVSGFTVAGVAGSFTAGQTASIVGIGTLSIAANGDYTFTPVANYNGSVPVATYMLTDGSSGDTSTLSITVTPVDDTFSDANEVVSVAEDTTLTGTVLSGTSSVDGPVTVSGFTVAGVAGSFTAGQTANIAGVGSLQINANGDYSFTPVANYNGPVPLATYTLTDGSSGDTSTLSISVTPVDDAFSDANEVLSVAEDTTLTGTVLSGTTSVDGPVTVSGFTVAGVAGSFTAGQTANIAGVGSLQINANGDYSFTPVANYNGPVPLATYTLTDGSSGDTSTLSITVTPVNDAPTVGNAAISVSEEGLAGGLADTLGAPGDTTDLAVRSGTIGIADVDSSLNVSLQAPVTALTAGGVAVTWSGAGSQTLVGSAGGVEVIRVTIDNGGNYQVSLSKALDHALTDSEDTLSFNVGVTATDGTNSASGVIALTVEDDAAQASFSAVSVGGTPTNTNLAIVLDLSGSMDFASGLTNATRLAVTKEAIKELIDTYDGMGDVMVNVTVFGSSGTNGTWMTAANALQFITTVQAFSTSSTMYTNYDAALASAMSAYGGAGKLSGSNVQNVLYFLSDGEPNLSDGNSSQLLNSTPTNSASDNGIQGAEETIWTNFLTNNSISAYAIGLGTGVTTANMDPVAYNGVTGTPRDSVAVTDLNDLSSVLASTIESRVTGAIMIDGSGAGGFGADGGYLAALTYGNNTFSFNGSTLTVSGAGTTAYSFNAVTHVLTVTAVGGPFVVDMNTGEYTYTRTPSSTITQEIFDYTLSDKDGDTASGTLTIDLPDYDTAPIGRDDLVTVASGSVSSNTVTVKDAWLTWNDSDAESTALTVSAVSNASSHTGNQVVDAVSGSSGGSGAFAYTVSDSSGQTNDAAVTITTRDSYTLNGTGLDNILIGDISGETIRGYEGNDVLVGNAGADTLDGGSGNDLLIGGTGNDSLTGGLGSDTFAWSLADQGTAGTPARDTITDFSTAAKSAGGDVLDLRDLLQGENHTSGTGNLTDYLHFTKSGSDTVIDVKPTGAAGSVTQQIVMSGVDLTANSSLNDQAIIQDLLTKGKLLTD